MRIKKKLTYILCFLLVALIAPNFIVQAVAGQWSSSGTTIYYNDGKVGIGTSSPADPLHVVTTATGDSSMSHVGKIYVGDNAGSWWILGSRGTDGRGSNNIVSNGYFNNGWYRRDASKETWTISTYNTENNSGYFRIFRAPTGTSTAIAGGDLKPMFEIKSTGQATIDGKLTVKELVVKTNVWADYVFDKDYKLKSIPELEQYIKTFGHLPGVSSEQEIKSQGLSLGEMQRQQMEEIEELTLYTIQQDKQIKSLEERLAKLERALYEK